MTRVIRITIPLALAAVAVLTLPAQKTRSPELPQWEVRWLEPVEVAPARYRQVERYEVERMAAEGWELVAVSPYVYRNEERGKTSEAVRPVVTQAYPAYYFRRLRPR